MGDILTCISEMRYSGGRNYIYLRIIFSKGEKIRNQKQKIMEKTFDCWGVYCISALYTSDFFCGR